MLENCRWLLYASRLYGCHPHTIDERSVLRNFRPLLAYSLLVCGAFCAVTCYMLYRDHFDKFDTIVASALQLINMYIKYLYMITTPLLSCLGHAKFERAVAASKKFDDLTRHYSRWQCRVDGGQTNAQRLVVAVIVVVWIVLAVLRKLIVPEALLDLIVLQSTMGAIFSMEIAKFCFLYDSLRRRFRRLNELCFKLTGVAVGFERDLRLSTSRRTKRPTISSLQRSYQCLTDAANHLSSHYSPQLFCWLVCLLQNIVTYILNVYKSDGLLLYIYCVLLLFWSFKIVALSHICHLTCDQANELAGMVLSLGTSVSKQAESMEAIELGVSLRMHPLRVRVCGLFSFDNGFIFSAFSVILMYVVLVLSTH